MMREHIETICVDAFHWYRGIAALPPDSIVVVVRLLRVDFGS